MQPGLVRADWLPEQLAPGYSVGLAADGRQVGVLLCTNADGSAEPDLTAGQVANACEKLALAVHTTYLKRQSERRRRQLQLISEVNQRITPLTIGVLDVQSDRRNAFDFVDLLALQVVANPVAEALENDRLLEQERRRRQMIQTLQETVRVISSSLELDRVLDLILRELGRVVTYDNVRLKRVEDDVAQVIAARGFRDLESVMGTTYLVSENTLAMS